MAVTMKGNLVNTQVFADSIQSSFIDQIKLYPLSYVQSFDNQQVGFISTNVLQFYW